MCSSPRLRNSEWTAHEYFRNSWEYGVILISRDWIHRLAPYFWGDGEIAPNFEKEISQCPHSPTCNQMAQHMKMGKYSFERGIMALHFGEKYASLPLLIFEEAWQTHCTSFI